MTHSPCLISFQLTTSYLFHHALSSSFIRISYTMNLFTYLFCYLMNPRAFLLFKSRSFSCDWYHRRRPLFSWHCLNSCLNHHNPMVILSVIFLLQEHWATLHRFLLTKVCLNCHYFVVAFVLTSWKTRYYYYLGSCLFFYLSLPKKNRDKTQSQICGFSQYTR